MKLLVDPLGLVVDNARGQQDGAGAEFFLAAADQELLAVLLEVGHPLGLA